RLTRRPAQLSGALSGAHPRAPSPRAPGWRDRDRRGGGVGAARPLERRRARGRPRAVPELDPAETTRSWSVARHSREPPRSTGRRPALQYAQICTVIAAPVQSAVRTSRTAPQSCNVLPDPSALDPGDRVWTVQETSGCASATNATEG